MNGSTRKRGSLVFSGVHIYFIDDYSTETKPFWHPRVYSVIVGLPKRRVVRALRTLYPRQSLQRRSNLEPEVALQATIQPEFLREITYKEDDGSTATRLDLLGGPALRQVAYWFVQFGMSARYSLIGARLTEDGIELNPGVQEWLEELAAFRTRRRNQPKLNASRPARARV